MAEKKYYVLSDIFNFLSYDNEFERKKTYPFNRKPENLLFSWGQVLIPAQGIKQMIQNKISDIDETPLKEIKMMYQIAFIDKTFGEANTGIINQDITLTFRYDKTYKYGDINKSIYEVCFFIYDNAKFTNDFYVLTDDMLFTFFSYFIIDNQWGIGRMVVGSPCCEKYIPNKAQTPIDAEHEVLAND